MLILLCFFIYTEKTTTDVLHVFLLLTLGHMISTVQYRSILNNTSACLEAQGEDCEGQAYSEENVDEKEERDRQKL